MVEGSSPSGWKVRNKVVQTEFADGQIKLINGDWFKHYQQVEQGSVNLVLSDPPYGLFGKELACNGLGWDQEVDLMKLEMTYDRVLSEAGQIILFCDLNLLYKLRESFTKFKFMHYLVWIKPSCLPANQYHPIPDTEFLAIFKREGVKTPALTWNPTAAQNGRPYKRINWDLKPQNRKMVKSPVNQNLTGERWIRRALWKW